MWDADDRAEDVRRLERGEFVLDEGHLNPGTTPLDADLDEVLDMPSESPWPFTTGVAMLLVAYMLLSGHLFALWVSLALLALCIGAWHWSETGVRTPYVAAAIDRGRRAMPGGWWGTLLFLCSEATLFGLLIASYFYLRFYNAQWPPSGVDNPKVLLPVVLTAILIASVVPLFLAVRAARVGRARAAWLLVLLAVVVQAAYLGVQIHEFSSELDKMDPTTSSYASIYFTLLGAHHLHVAVGILAEVFLLARLATGLTNYRLVGLRCIALYWYVVAALGVAVVLTQISPSL
jgi:cytochrome c oxidase subunit 3/cytochrome c oxidase subunit I+III